MFEVRRRYEADRYAMASPRCRGPAMNWYLVVVGGVMAAVGFWGWRNVARLIPPSLSAQSRTHQEGVLQRGSALLVLVGAGFVLFAIYAMIRG